MNARWGALVAVVMLVAASVIGVVPSVGAVGDPGGGSVDASPAFAPTPVAGSETSGTPSAGATAPGPWEGWTAPTFEDPVGLLGPVTAVAVAPDPGVATVTPPEPESLVETATYGLVPADQLILVLREGLDRAAAEGLVAGLGGTIVGEVELLDAYQVQTSARTEAELEATLEAARALEGVLLATTNQGTAPLQEGGEIWGVRISPLQDPVYAGDADDGYEAHRRADRLGLHPGFGHGARADHGGRRGHRPLR